MGAYLLDWAAMLTRWLHLIAGVAWIGASFYFIWLDNSLKAPKDEGLKAKGVAGELWAVHGGGFYNPQKYLVAPATLPAELHWFKWEAYTTWISGFFLLTWVYYFNASAFLIDQAVLDMTPMTAIAASLGVLAGGWLVYDLLCRSPLGKVNGLLAIIGFALLVLATWGITKVFSPRAAYLHVGAMIGTMMAANVRFIIIPGQRRMVDAMKRGEAPNPEDGRRAKQRSVHNNYLTLPVLFIMVSNHFPMTYQHPKAWLVLTVIMIAGVIIRHFFNLKHKGQKEWALPAIAAVLFVILIIALRPEAEAEDVGPVPTFDEVQVVLGDRCTRCHSPKPKYPGLVAPPQGLNFEDPAIIQANAERIHRQVVELRAMPQGNVTKMTEEERELVGRWCRAEKKKAR